MGLIKTAIMTGGGMYAVNKIAKTVEQRPSSNHNNNSQNYPRDNPYPPQGYYGPPPPPFQGPSQHRAAWDETYGECQDYQDQRDWYPRNGNGMTGAKSGGYSFPADGDYDGKYLQPSDYPYQPAYIRQSDNPPSYSPRPQYVRPRSYAQPQIQSYEQPRGQQSLSSLRDRATGMAMDYMSNGKGKSEKKDKGSKGSELLSEFFK